MIIYIKPDTTNVYFQSDKDYLIDELMELYRARAQKEFTVDVLMQKIDEEKRLAQYKRPHHHELEEIDTHQA